VFIICGIILLLTQIVVISQNRRLKDNLQKSSSMLEQNNERYRLNVKLFQKELEFNGRFLPFISRIEKEFDDRIFSMNRVQRPVMLLFFSNNDCNSCLDDEIKIWNKFVEETNPNDCLLIGITEKPAPISEERLKRALKIQFSILAVDSLKIKLSKDYGMDELPALFLGDLNTGRIIRSFHPFPGRKSDAYFLKGVRDFIEYTNTTNMNDQLKKQ